jgi:ABC-2 type transport system ATP-binding protein
LFLDEPTTGLDPDMSQRLREEIARLNRATGLTILLTTHNLREAERLCSDVAFLKAGRLVARGRIRDLQAHLGLGDHLTLVFQGEAPPLDYHRLPGVLHCRLDAARVHLVLDRAEIRLAAILAAVAQTSGHLLEVKVKEADLEELYREITH